MQFDIEILVSPGLVIFVATLLIAFKVTRSFVFSMSAALIKAGLFMIYFGLFFDGTFTFLDDWVYLDNARQMYDDGIRFTNFIENVDYLRGFSGADHYGYSLYNVFAFQLFGYGYYAPVALNIVLTALIAWFGANLADIEFGFNGVWKKLFFVFLLLHPDIVAWSTILNGKDTLVLLLHILLLYSVSMYFRRQLFASVGLAFFVCTIVATLRFYVPVVFASALALSLLKMPKNYSSMLTSFVGFFAVVIFLANIDLQWTFQEIQKDFVNPFYGLIHFLLTPIPFYTEPAYKFLDIPALIHWLFMPFAIMGIITMLKRPSDYERFFLFYIMLFLALYACYDGLQGPRHRVQIDFAWAVIQFMGIKSFLRKAFMPASSFRSNPSYIKIDL
jgi:hypothetical protein